MGLTVDVLDFVRSAAYPGRVVVVGNDPAGVPFALYALSGRSEASKRRAFKVEPEQVEVYGTRGQGDDPLRHYVAARLSGGTVLVGNGDHVDELYPDLVENVPLEAILGRIEPEPDPPIWTPRIGVVASISDGSLADIRAFGVSRRAEGRSEEAERHVLVMTQLPPGCAVAVRTYKGSVADVVVDGIPVALEVRTGWQVLVDAVREAIPADVRVGVFASELSDHGSSGVSAS